MNGTIGISEDGVPARNIESPSGGGVRSLPGAAENCLPMMFPTAPVPSANGPQLELLEHMVHTQTDPAGQFAATGTPPPSDCYPVGPVGPYVAGGPVGPDVYNTDPDSLTHMVRIPPDPDGQDAAATGTPSPYDCYPVGPVGPYVAGALLAHMFIIQIRIR